MRETPASDSRRFQAVHHDGVNGVVECWDDRAHQAGSRGPKCTGGPVWYVAEFVDRPQNPLAFGFADPGVVIQYPRYR